MNKIFTIVLLFLLVACSPSGTDFIGQTKQKLSGPVAAYAFEEGSGYKANEISGNSALQGTLYNGVGWTNSGKHGNGVTFPSGGTFIQINDAASLHLTTGMTLSAWVNPTSTNYPGAVIAKEGSSNPNYALFAGTGTNIPQIQYTNNNITKSISDTTSAIGSWTYIAGTYDGTTLRMYRDGVLTASATQPSPMDTSTGWLEIGSDTNIAAYFRGTIDDVRVYDRALSQSEIQSDMNTGVGQTPVDASVDAPSDSNTEAEAATVTPEAGSESGSDSGASVYPLKLVTGKRYLADQTDKPFLMQADTAWSLPARLQDADAEIYLEDRRVKGFNTVLIELINHLDGPSGINNAYNIAPFNVPGDFSTPNDAYFTYIDAVLQKALSKNLLVIAFPAYLGYTGTNEGWMAEMITSGATKCAAYGTYLGNRYKNYPNIIWANGGDDSTADKSLVDAIASAIRAAGATQLQTAHAYPDVSARAYYGSYTWLDVDTVYRQTPSILAASLVEYNLVPIKPFFLIESAYEGGTTSPNAQVVRQEAYEPLLGGGFGQFFGNYPLWIFDSGWQAALNSQGSLDMQRLHTLFTSRRWDLLVPDQTSAFITSGGSGISAARASDGSWGIVYIPTTRNMMIDLSGFSHPVNAKWFDPTNGTYTTIQCSPFNNCGTRSILSTPGNNSAGDQDWILVFE